MPKRTDLQKILIIGSGPIVIGQACEFDYSGTQACKALREEGFEVVLVNSNPATIMTDPEMADRTYIEPLTPEFVAKIIERERPDALLPTLGGQTGAEPGDGAGRGRRPRALRRRADRRQARRDQEGRGPRALQAGHGADRPRAAQARRLRAARSRRRSRSCAARIGFPPIIRPSLHPGRHRRLASPTTPRSCEGVGQAGACSMSPGPAGADRGVGHRLEGVRARGDARRRRQRRHHLLDRELRPDGRAHRRLDHRGARPDADRQGVPADARRRPRDHPRDRRRDRRLQHPVRGQPRRRAAWS